MVSTMEHLRSVNCWEGLEEAALSRSTLQSCSGSGVDPTP